MLENGLMDSPHVGAGTLHAWLDGALSMDESTAVQSHLVDCGACSAAAAEARGVIAASTRILSALDDIAGDVIHQANDVDARPVGAALGTSYRGSARSVRRYAPIAAAAGLAIAATLVLRQSPPQRHQPVSVAARPPAALSVRAHGETTMPAVVEPRPMGGTNRAGARTSRASAPVASAPVASAPSASTAKQTGSFAEAQDAGMAVAKPRSSDAPHLPDESVAAVSSRSRDSLALTGRVVAATGRPIPPETVTVAGAGAVTGAATAQPAGFSGSPPTIAGARLVSSELSEEGDARVRRTRYELGPGTQITLLERRSARLRARRALDAASADTATADTATTNPVQSAVRESQARAGAALAAPRAMRQAIHSVSWVASDGTVLLLSGALSTEELEALRSRIDRRM